MQKYFGWLKASLIGVVGLLGMEQAAFGKTFKEDLIRIVDGDTVVAGENTIRLLGIDTPESHFLGHFQTDGETNFGAEATEHLYKILNAVPGSKPVQDLETKKTIVIETEVNDDPRLRHDVHGRTLAYLYLGKTNINLQMVRDGMAVPYLYCAHADCDKQWFEDAEVEAFMDACVQARKEKLGVFFRTERPLREIPGDFRHRLGKKAAYQYIGNYETKRLFKPGEKNDVDVCKTIKFETEKDALALGYDY